MKSFKVWMEAETQYDKYMTMKARQDQEQEQEKKQSIPGRSRIDTTWSQQWLNATGRDPDWRTQQQNTLPVTVGSHTRNPYSNTFGVEPQKPSSENPSYKKYLAMKDQQTELEKRQRSSGTGPTRPDEDPSISQAWHRATGRQPGWQNQLGNVPVTVSGSDRNPYTGKFNDYEPERQTNINDPNVQAWLRATGRKPDWRTR